MGNPGSINSILSFCESYWEQAINEANEPATEPVTGMAVTGELSTFRNALTKREISFFSVGIPSAAG